MRKSYLSLHTNLIMRVPAAEKVPRHASGEYLVHYSKLQKKKKQRLCVMLPLLVFLLFHWLLSNLLLLDVYSSLNLQPQLPSTKFLKLNKSSFDCFTQKNIRRNLISANHIKQMKMCRDLQHIVAPIGDTLTFDM